MDNGYLRIGEFSERVGINADLLRAWERRYGVLQPDRSAGGFRLYSDTDVARVRRMASLIDEGLSPAEAARITLAADCEPTPSPPTAPSFAQELERLLEPLMSFDDRAAQRAFDRLLTSFDLDTVLAEIVMPLLGEIGNRWADGAITVAQEHYASHMLRARLLALARGWGDGLGPCAILAGAPGEEHDIGLVAFGLALWRRGWRIVFLGGNTPAEALRDTTRTVSPDLVVVTAVDTTLFPPLAPTLRSMTADTVVGIAGAGADQAYADEIGARLFDGDPVTAADDITRMVSANLQRSKA